MRTIIILCILVCFKSSLIYAQNDHDWKKGSGWVEQRTLENGMVWVAKILPMFPDPETPSEPGLYPVTAPNRQPGTVINRVGIGTDRPLAKLHIALEEIDELSPYKNILKISSQGGTTNFYGDEITSEGIAPLYLNKKNQAKVVVPILEITGGSDLAEPFEIAGRQNIERGMLVRIDTQHPGQLCVSTKAYDRAVAGIVSGANGLGPGLTMKKEGSNTSSSLPVALTGRVFCWADADDEPIQPGDLLTTADTPGHAMKAIDYDKAKGAIIGKAMSKLNEGRGLVLVLVTLQ